MKNLVIINTTIAVSCSDSFLDKIKDNAAVTVANNSFHNNSRYVMDARVVDIEVLDNSIDIFELLDERKIKVEAKVEYDRDAGMYENFEVGLL